MGAGDMTDIIGSVETTPGVLTYPSTIWTRDTTNPGLLVKFGASAPAGQAAIRTVNNAAHVGFEVLKTGPIHYDSHVGATESVFNAATALDAGQNPPCIQIADGGAGFIRIWSGTGVPTTAGKVGTARVGDWYLRRDTPSTANQRVYVCSVAGSPGTWVGIA